MLEVVIPSLSKDRKRRYEAVVEERKKPARYESYDSLEDYTETEKEEEYDSGDDYVPTKKAANALLKTRQKEQKQKEKKVKAPPEPPSKAKVSMLAEPEMNANQSCKNVHVLRKT